MLLIVIFLEWTPQAFLLQTPLIAAPSHFSIPLTIHLNQKFWFDPAAGFMFVRCSSSATDGVDLVYEDGCWCIKPGLREENSLRDFFSAIQQKYFDLQFWLLWDLGSAGQIHVHKLTISNSRRTSFSDSPLYLEVRVEEDTLKKVVPHSVATALANMVFPVPGGPTISTP